MLIGSLFFNRSHKSKNLKVGSLIYLSIVRRAQKIIEQDVKISFYDCEFESYSDANSIAS